ncbi:MAG: diacylglycerol kinase family protein [Caldilineaceae bacterium SB0665_bin_25]|nr:diacylglycerol kinase family protein [Caldilineaceae bacterium SB0665_bin_25]
MPSHSIWRSMGFAFEGLRYAFRSQRSLRIESIIAGFIVVIGFALDISRLEWVIVIISIFVTTKPMYRERANVRMLLDDVE